MSVFAARQPVGKNWTLSNAGGDNKQFNLTAGGQFTVITTDLPDVLTCQKHRIGDMVKDMVGATVDLQNIILDDVILPEYRLPSHVPPDGARVDYYQLLMDEKGDVYAKNAPYITEGIFARSAVTCKGIGDFKWICQESGDKGELFSTNWTNSNQANVKRINTAAIHTDPSSTTAGVNFQVWPPIGDTITFGPTCLNRFGFPTGLTWSAKTEAVDTFIYTIKKPRVSPNTPIDELQFTNKQSGVLSLRLIPDEITKGNKARMDIFKKEIASESFNVEKALQLSVFKEEGDLMQIIEFLCYYYAGTFYLPGNDPFEDRKKAVMVTTDEVVFSICARLGIPCIYTGGRSIDPETGVHISGYGAYQFYNPVLDRLEAYKNKINNIYNTKKNINDIQAQLLTDIMWNGVGPKKNIYYYKQGGRHEGMRVCFVPTPANMNQFNAYLTSLISGIEAKNKRLDALKNAALVAVVVDGANIDGIIAVFDTDSTLNLTPLYIDKTKAMTSVDRDTISTVYNCIDIELCTKLSNSFAGGKKKGTKITGGGIKQEFNVDYDRSTDVLNSDESVISVPIKEYLTVGEYNLLIIVFYFLRDYLFKMYIDKLSVLIRHDDDDGVLENVRYSHTMANSICAHVYSRYAYSVALINTRSEHNGEGNSIGNLCAVGSLRDALNSATIFAKLPDLWPFFSATPFQLDEFGYIIELHNLLAIEEAIKKTIVFVDPAESYILKHPVAAASSFTPPPPPVSSFNLGAAAAARVQAPIRPPVSSFNFGAAAAAPFVRSSQSFVPPPPAPSGFAQHNNPNGFLHDMASLRYDRSGTDRFDRLSNLFELNTPTPNSSFAIGTKGTKRKPITGPVPGLGSNVFGFSPPDPSVNRDEDVKVGPSISGKKASFRGGPNRSGGVKKNKSIKKHNKKSIKKITRTKIKTKKSNKNKRTAKQYKQ